MKKTLLICLSVLMIALVGCKKETNTWGMLKEGSVTVNVGDSVQLTFTNNGNTCPQWSVDDDFYATVNGSGLVKGVHVGKCVVEVNGLQCTVNVTDAFEGKVYNPWQESWSTVYDSAEVTSMIIAYENSKRESVIAEVTIDSLPRLAVTEERDTAYNPDGSISSIRVYNDTTVVGQMYMVTKMVFDYTQAGLADRYVDKVVYNFSIERLNPGVGDEYGSRLESCSMSTAKHGTDLETYIANRYSMTNSGKAYYYYWAGKKTCDIIVDKTASETTIKYAANR